jgi:hypothetical protein
MGVKIFTVMTGGGLTCIRLTSAENKPLGHVPTTDDEHLNGGRRMTLSGFLGAEPSSCAHPDRLAPSRASLVYLLIAQPMVLTL